MKKIIKYIIAAVAVVSVFVVLFALLGVGVFLLPLLGGAFTKERILKYIIHKYLFVFSRWRSVRIATAHRPARLPNGKGFDSPAGDD